MLRKFCSSVFLVVNGGTECSYVLFFLWFTSVSGHYRCLLCGPTAEKLLLFACHTVARSAARSHPSENLAIAQRSAPLTAGTLAPVWLWPYGRHRGAAMTRNVPGKIPITERSPQKPTSAVNTAALWRAWARAKQPLFSAVTCRRFLLKRAKTKVYVRKRRSSACCNLQKLGESLPWWRCDPDKIIKCRWGFHLTFTVVKTGHSDSTGW